MPPATRCQLNPPFSVIFSFLLCCSFSFFLAFQIRHLDGFDRFAALGRLDLSCNKLEFAELFKLRHVHIMSLDLYNNPLTADPLYREHVMDILPHLVRSVLASKCMLPCWLTTFGPVSRAVDAGRQADHVARARAGQRPARPLGQRPISAPQSKPKRKRRRRRRRRGGGGKGGEGMNMTK